VNIGLPVAHKSKSKAVATRLSEPSCNSHNVLLCDSDVRAHAACACSSCYSEMMKENESKRRARNVQSHKKQMSKSLVSSSSVRRRMRVGREKRRQACETSKGDVTFRRRFFDARSRRDGSGCSLGLFCDGGKGRGGQSVLFAKQDYARPPVMGGGLKNELERRRGVRYMS
jgi:hypothetical protein